MASKKGMTNVDVAALVAELRPLMVGGRFDKAYQPGKEEIMLRVRKKGPGRLDLFMELGRYATVVRRPPENPDQPSMVAKLLRRDLGNARLTSIRQVGFDRVMRFDFERGDGRRSLVLELFGEGNLLLLDPDDEDRILLPMRGVDHGVRRLKRGELYVAPPGGTLPFTMPLADLTSAGREANKDVVRFLALGLGFGPQWAEELCHRAGVRKNLAAADASDDDWANIHAAVHALGDEIARNDLAPQIIHQGEEAVDATPFALAIFPEPKYASQQAGSFIEALDEFFRGSMEEGEDEDPRQPRYQAARAKLQRRLDQMQGALDGFTAEEDARRADGDALYGAFQAVQSTLDALAKARETHPWTTIAKRIADAQGTPAAGIVRELRPHDARAFLELTLVDGGTRVVEVDVRKTVQDNADDHYAASKKARSRHAGAIGAYDDHVKQLKALEAKGLDGFGAAPKKQEGPSKHFWFETYRWSLSPGGLLLVGGRSASQNDTVVKKYLRDGDRYVHAAIHGAPSVVVRAPDGAANADASDEDLEVACQFAACASRAWRQFASASAYWVTPQQVNKTPRSGEFVPKGAWIIHGRRNILDGLPMAWCMAEVAFTKGGIPLPADADAANAVLKITGGPPRGLAPFARRTMDIFPGDQDPNDAAAAIAEAWEIDVEAVQGALPPGPIRWQA